MAAPLITVIAALLLPGAAQSSPGDEASILDQNARAENVRAEKQAFDEQLAAAARFMRDNNMSEKGVSTVLAGIRTEQQEERRISDQGLEDLKAVRAAAEAEPFDIATFEAALKRERDNQAAAFSTALNAELEIFRALSSHDQPIFARLMHTASGGRLGIPPRPLRGAH